MLATYTETVRMHILARRPHHNIPFALALHNHEVSHMDGAPADDALSGSGSHEPAEGCQRAPFVSTDLRRNIMTI